MQPRTITASLVYDHRLSSNALDGLDACLSMPSMALRHSMTACGIAILRHVDIEENVLFPQLEAAQPSLAGLIAALRADHSAIRAALHGIEDAVRADDRERARAAIGGLRERLDAHHALEERELHPALAGSLCDAPQVVSLFEDAHLRHSGR